MALITSDCDAMRSLRIKWPGSPRIVMHCAPCAPNGPDHLGLCVLQWTASTPSKKTNRTTSNSTAMATELVYALSSVVYQCWETAPQDAAAEPEPEPEPEAESNGNDALARSSSAGEPRPTAAIPMDNPY